MLKILLRKSSFSYFALLEAFAVTQRLQPGFIV